ncbi:MAG: dockerin type I domain-containing protein, partial [Aliarcobacter sp.]
PTHTYTEVGTYTVTLTATNAYGGDTETTTITASTIYPFPGIALLPQDLDADGRYEDVNGNGRLDFNDLTIFFKNLAWAKTNEPIEAFDFNNNGRIDYKDVILLFNEIKEAST